MANNTLLLQYTSSAGYGSIPIGGIPSQQGFGQIQTSIFTFFNNANWPVTSSFGQIVYMLGTNVATSAIADVSDYNNFVFQPDMSGSSGGGTATFTVSSSIDGCNWVGEFISSQTPASPPTYIVPTGSFSYRRRFFGATYSGSGNATGSLYMICGQ